MRIVIGGDAPRHVCGRCFVRWPCLGVHSAIQQRVTESVRLDEEAALKAVGSKGLAGSIPVLSAPIIAACPSTRL